MKKKKSKIQVEEWMKSQLCAPSVESLLALHGAQNSCLSVCKSGIRLLVGILHRDAFAFEGFDAILDRGSRF